MPETILISGRNSLEAALAASCRFVSLEVALPAQQKVNSFLQDMGLEALTPIARITDKKGLTKKMAHNRHQGLVARIELALPGVDDLLEQAESSAGLLVALDHIEDPHNAGAIIRTAAALGMTGVILPQKRGVSVGDGLIRASAGAALRSPPALISGSLADLALRLSRRGWQIIGLMAEGEPIRAFERRDSPALLVVGSEHTGIKPLLQKRCTDLLSIPMRSDIESLNASVAAGIAMAFLR